jgi:hypothetical protein
VEHPHGRGHVKQTPAAAAHGQETAASHKPERTESSSGSEPGSGKSKSAEHPAHPDPPRDAGNLLPAPCRRTRVQVATRQAIQVAPDGSAAATSWLCTQSKNFHSGGGAGGLALAKWVGKSIGLRG